MSFITGVFVRSADCRTKLHAEFSNGYLVYSMSECWWTVSVVHVVSADWLVDSIG